MSESESNLSHNQLCKLWPDKRVMEDAALVHKWGAGPAFKANESARTLIVVGGRRRLITARMILVECFNFERLQ